MANVISIMVLPTGSNEALPQILLERNGIWVDMSPALDVRMLTSVSEIRQRIDSLLVEMMSQIRGNQVPSWAALKAAFRRHYNAIVPSGVNAVLQEALQTPANETTLLRIHTHTSTEWIPWEILHDGIDFLGVRCQIARLPIVGRATQLNHPTRRQISQIYSFLGKNVFHHSLAAQLNLEWKDTFVGVPQATVIQHQYPVFNGAVANFPNVDHVVDAALDGDILHITCHGGLQDKDGQFYWTLDHNSTLTFSYHINANILSDLNLSRGPLVFGNACTSSQPGDGQGGLASGFGSQFFAQGALAFVGTFAPITQKMAVLFASRFYKFLFGIGGNGAIPVAQALFEAKKHFLDAHEIDPSYLYYCLYGPAETIFEV
jgi:CHAT domain-containing protein